MDRAICERKLITECRTQLLQQMRTLSTTPLAIGAWKTAAHDYNHTNVAGLLGIGLELCMESIRTSTSRSLPPVGGWLVSVCVR